MFSRKSMGEKIYIICNYFLLALAAFIAIYPFINIISTSFSSSRAILSGEVVFLPVEPTLQNFRMVLEDGQIFQAFKNSVTITLVGTAFNMAATVMVAYPLSKQRLMGRSIFLKLITFTMIFGGGMIPSFILVKQLGLMNTYGALWFPGLVSTFNMFVLKNYFQSIPMSLEEAAAIDGANDIYILCKIMLPLALPTLATLTLFYAVGWWNSYMNVIMYINNTGKLNMSAKLIQMIDNMNIASSAEGIGATQMLTPEGITATTIVIATAPILVVYPFLQKYFVKGVMVGSVKG